MCSINLLLVYYIIISDLSFFAAVPNGNLKQDDEHFAHAETICRSLTNSCPEALVVDETDTVFFQCASGDRFQIKMERKPI
jgi:hypothetical protein